MKLSEVLNEAKRAGYAVGAFNIFNYASAAAAIRAAEEVHTPVILQTSTSTVRKFGPEPLAGMLLPLIKQAAVPVVLHLDHCTDPDMADACMAAGWDSVMIDASHFPLAENIRITAAVVSRAHALGIDVEGELGTIEGVEEDISHSHSVHASYEDSLTFVNETGIDAFAPAIGTAHGVYKGEPHIEFSLVEQLANAVSCPIVIHGGTGLSEDTFCRLIKNGATKINVSTALKHAYVEGIAQYLSDNPGKTEPLALDEAAFLSVKETVRRHIRLFGKE